MAVYTDAFTGTVDTDLDVYDATWVNIGPGLDTIEIGAANNIRHDVDTAGGAYLYNQTFNSKHYAKLKITDGAGYIGPAIRMAAGPNFYYCFAANGGVYNGECISSSLSDWDGGQAGIADNDICEIRVDDTVETTIPYVVNGSTVQTYTSKSSLSGGKAGVCNYGSGGIADDWEGGDVGGGVATRKFQRASILGV